MARGKPAQVRVVEEIPVRYDETDEDSNLTLKGVKDGRIRFEPEEGDPFEMSLDDLIEALIYVDQSGIFAKRIMEELNA